MVYAVRNGTRKIGILLAGLFGKFLEKVWSDLMVRLEPPGPAPLPLLGSLPLIGLGKVVPGFGPPPHVRMVKLAEEYGDVMTLHFGTQPWVVLSSPHAVHEAFVTQADAFSGRPMVPSMDISSGGGQAFAGPLPNKNLRRVAFGSLFDASSVARRQDQLDEEVELLANHLVKASAASVAGVELRPSVRRAVTNMVLRYAFSSRVPFETEDTMQGGAVTERSNRAASLVAELSEVVEQIWAELTATTTTSADLLTPAGAGSVTQSLYAPLRRLVASRDALLRALVAERRDEPRAAREGVEPDMLDTLLAAGLPEGEVRRVRSKRSSAYAGTHGARL
jgi:hypothetical protein